MRATRVSPCRVSSPDPLRRQDGSRRGVRFEEDTGAADHTSTRGQLAYAMATNITRSFKLFGWCSRIRGVESGERSKACQYIRFRPTMAAST